MPTEVTVRLFGTPMELAKVTELKVIVNSLTPRDIIKEIADANKALSNSIIRADGTPRISTKILINGGPPASLDDPIPAGATIILSMPLPCDG